MVLKKKKFKNSPTNLYTYFLCMLIKKGKKNNALKILNFFLYSLYRIYSKPIFMLLNKLFLCLNTFVETKIIRKRKRKYVVPFLINLKRRLFLITHWILFVIKKEKYKTFSERLIKEVSLLLKGVSSASFNLKKINNSKALQNRSNMHYRW